MNYEEILEKAKEFDEVIPTIANKELKNLAKMVSEGEVINDMHVGTAEHKDEKKSGKCLLVRLNDRIVFVKADSHLSIPYENIDAVGLAECRMGMDLAISIKDDDQILVFNGDKGKVRNLLEDIKVCGVKELPTERVWNQGRLTGGIIASVVGIGLLIASVYGHSIGHPVWMKHAFFAALFLGGGSLAVLSAKVSKFKEVI